MTPKQYAAQVELQTGDYRNWSVDALTASARMAEELETPVSGDALAHYRRVSPRTLARRRATVQAHAAAFAS